MRSGGSGVYVDARTVDVHIGRLQKGAERNWAQT